MDAAPPDVEWENLRVPLVSTQGISKPGAAWDPAFGRLFRGQLRDDHQLIYRGTGPLQRDSVGLREAMRRRTPLIFAWAISLNI